MKKCISVYALLLMFPYSADSMCMEPAVPMDTQSLSALDVFVMHGINQCDHMMIISCGAVNKRCDAWLRKTAPNRRLYLQDLARKQGLSISRYETCHKYGSACGRKLIDCATVVPSQQFQLKLKYWFLDNEKVTFRKSYGWKILEARTPCFPSVHFTADGDLGYHDWSTGHRFRVWGTTTQLLEYDLRKDGISQLYTCGISAGAYGEASFFQIATLPVLMKAILNSSVVTKRDSVKMYSLQNAKIPENYREYKSSPASPTDNSFDDLPEDFQQAIVNRYTTQHDRLIEK